MILTSSIKDPFLNGKPFKNVICSAPFYYSPKADTITIEKKITPRHWSNMAPWWLSSCVMLLLCLLTCLPSPQSVSHLFVNHTEFDRGATFVKVVITPLLPKVYSDIHHIANQWGNSQWWIWLCGRYWMRHYWLINGNEAHLVMLMMMTLSQQETGNQWNGPWLKIITMPAGGPVRSRVHNMPLLILIFDLRYDLRGWYEGPFSPFVPHSYPSN